MLLIIIDILERLLAWLKPFTRNKDLSLHTEKNVDEEFLLAKPSNQQVVAKFNLRCADPDNVDPKIRGEIEDRDTRVIVIPVSQNKEARANQVVWDHMERFCGPRYYVRNLP